MPEKSQKKPIKQAPRVSALSKGRSKKAGRSTSPVKQRHDLPLHSKKLVVTQKRVTPPQDISKLTLGQLRPDISPRSIQFDLMFDLAKKFGLEIDAASKQLKPGEWASFDAAWKVSKVWRKLSQDFEQGKVYRGMSMHAPVEDAYAKLKQIIAHPDWKGVNSEGYRQVTLRPMAGKYVIFSDHHRATNAQRQNFFRVNNALYVDALKRYQNAGYTVVENGDVEELFVRRYSKGEYEKWLTLTFPQLRQRRRELRLKVLREIMDAPENRELYDVLGSLSANGQLIRVLGNHDPDLQYPEFVEQLRTRLPKLNVPADFLFLHTSDASKQRRLEMIVAHGHHFDHYSNPTNAPYLGELISETMSWAYQGADRNWKWAKDGGNVGQWLDGSTPFRNELVSAAPLKMGVETLFRLNDPREAERFFESVLDKNVAWEYFKNKNPGDAFCEEVMTGKSFFKFRHMDEIEIMNQWNQAFPDERSRPKLLLGHSHEVRINPLIPGTKRTYPWLLNSGAAGRFENLVWGIELDNGEAQVIAWSHQDRIKKRQAQRYVYQQTKAGLIPQFSPLSG